MAWFCRSCVPARQSPPTWQSKGNHMFYSVNIGLTAIIIVLVLVLVNAIKVLREYQRGVIFTLGRFSSVKGPGLRSEEHTSELQSLMRISYAVFCLKKKQINQ